MRQAKSGAQCPKLFDQALNLFRNLLRSSLAEVLSVRLRKRNRHAPIALMFARSSVAEINSYTTQT